MYRHKLSSLSYPAFVQGNLSHQFMLYMVIHKSMPGLYNSIYRVFFYLERPFYNTFARISANLMYVTRKSRLPNKPKVVSYSSLGEIVCFLLPKGKK